MRNYEDSPVDSSGNVVGAENGKTFWAVNPTTGGWDAIELPEDVECKAVFISVVDGDDSVFETDIGNFGFLFSTNSDGTGWNRKRQEGFSMGFSKSAGDVNRVIGYIKAAIGNVVSVQILY